jgi:hypothetical protein
VSDRVTVKFAADKGKVVKVQAPRKVSRSHWHEHFGFHVQAIEVLPLQEPPDRLQIEDLVRIPRARHMHNPTIALYGQTRRMGNSHATHRWTRVTSTHRHDKMLVFPRNYQRDVACT